MYTPQAYEGCIMGRPSFPNATKRALNSLAIVRPCPPHTRSIFGLFTTCVYGCVLGRSHLTAEIRVAWFGVEWV